MSEDSQVAGTTQDPATEDTSMDIRQIMEVLPHRAPFLLVDKVLWRDGLVKARGLKNLTGSEYFFEGHFPGNPEIPKPLLIEMMAQMGAACVFENENNKGKLILFASIDDCTFGRAPVPGDTLLLEVKMESLRRDMGKMRATCHVGEELLASALLMFALADKAV